VGTLFSRAAYGACEFSSTGLLIVGHMHTGCGTAVATTPTMA
jgi:hypothetical protein